MADHKFTPFLTLATDMANLPIIGSEKPAAEVLKVAEYLYASSQIRTSWDEEEEAEKEKEANAYLTEKLDELPKGRAWWMPPHNLALNQAMAGYNLWQFTILPFFPERKSYRESENAIVIHPTWRSVQGRNLRSMDMELARALVDVMQKTDTVQETVRKELSWVETKFSIQIPSAIQAKLQKDAQATATRRWAANRLKTKDRLIPLDSSPPRDLGAFD